MKLKSKKLSLVIASIIFFAGISEKLMEKADEFFKNHKYQKAREIYKTLLSSDKREEAMYKLGLCYYKLQQFDSAGDTLFQFLNNYKNSRFFQKALYYFIEINIKTKNKEFVNFIHNLEEKVTEISVKYKILEYYEVVEKYDFALSFLEKHFNFSIDFINKKVKYLGYLKKYEQAINFLKEAETKLPDNIEIKRELAKVLRHTGRINEAIRYYKKIYSITHNADDLVELGRTYASAGKKEKAIEVWNSLIDIYGLSYNTLKKIANLYQEFGFYKELIKFYDYAQSRGFNFIQEKIDTYLILGEYEKAINLCIDYMLNSNFYTGLEKLKKISFEENLFSYVVKILSKRLSETKDLKTKEKLLKAYYTLKPDTDILLKYISLPEIDKKFLDDITENLLKKKDYKTLNTVYTNIELKKVSPSTKLSFCEMLIFYKKYKEALGILNKMTSRFFRHKIEYFKSLIYYKMGNLKQAEKIAEESMEYPENGVLYFKILLTQKKYRKAEDVINDLKIGKDRKLYLRGILEIFKENEPAGFIELEKLCKLYPESKYTSESLFYMYLRNLLKEKSYELIRNLFIMNYKGAVEYINQAGFSEPVIKFLEALVLKKEGKIDESIKLLEELKKTEDKTVTPYVLIQLAELYKQKGEKEKSKKLYRLLINRFPFHYVTGEARRNIE